MRATTTRTVHTCRSIATRPFRVPLNRQATDVSSRFLVLVACTIGTRGRLDRSARVFATTTSSHPCDLSNASIREATQSRIAGVIGIAAALLFTVLADGIGRLASACRQGSEQHGDQPWSGPP